MLEGICRSPVCVFEEHSLSIDRRYDMIFNIVTSMIAFSQC